MQLTTEACLALEKMGFPQDAYNSPFLFKRYEFSTRWEHHWPPTSPVNRQFGWVTCPDPLTALTFLEEQGFVELWWRDPALTEQEGPWGAEMSGRIDPNDDDSGSPIVRGDDPNALILAIAEYHRKQSEGQ